MKTPRALFTATVAAVAAATVLSAPATAAEKDSTLELMLVHGDQVRRTTLTCQPHGGTHPEAAAACADLQQAQGNFANLPGVKDKTCTMEYNPVDAKAMGTWRGAPVEFNRHFGNPCTVNAMTGPVFRF
ncbi:subtilase-type protease inhibitor [Allokutzneria sp. A3M-2-11 16]|uniref:SSI family serine proteinase inhibitor n=1 Tax=Allokutzneria sp. A3M-2-11 16 TaxID=2962043 RepID=UPI0020B6AE16|nr:SSI family serine proteinase inhibitor [Allokutzneria sp. A3M-2-11 16]MCP3798927.1 subtilase-type protease inhibitor [Allokutzneria sp. A3M-2-11 16]